LLGRSLDDISDLLDIPLSEYDAGLLSARMQAIRVIVTVSAKLGIEQRRSRDWQAYLEELRGHERELEAALPGADGDLPRAEKARSAKKDSSPAPK